MQDDEIQSTAATKLIESMCTRESPGFISLVVLCEFSCVLSKTYKFRRTEIAAVLERLLGSAEVGIEHRNLAEEALRAFVAGKADYADYVIGVLHRSYNAEVTYTFDRKAAKHPLFRAVPIR
jgi:predicted nucleic-acid-binding protein